MPKKRKSKQPRGVIARGDWYEIRSGGAPGAAEILIYGDIGDSWEDESLTAAEFVKAIQALEADTVTVRINSHGGSVADGLAIYNAIRRHPADTAVEVDGVAVSIASMIAMAGDTIHMAANAMMMIHAPWVMAMGNATELRNISDMLDKFAKAMGSAYERSGKGQDEILALLGDGEDHWYTAEEAVAEGFADDITEALQIAASLDLSRYRDMPAAAAAITVDKETLMPTKTKAAQSGAEEEIMHKDDPKKEPVDVVAVAEEARAEAMKTEQVRRTGVRAIYAPFASRPEMVHAMDAALDDPAITVAAASKMALDKLGEGEEPIVPPGANVEVGKSAREKFVEGASKALLARAGVEKQDHTNEFRGLRLVDMAREAMELANVSMRGKTGMEVVGAAFTQSTSDFPVLLENTMHKSLLAAYERAATVWRSIARAGSVSDFRAHPRLRLGGFSTLDTINENGEFKYQGIPDARKESITATTKGNLINLSRQMIVNDDLDGFMRYTDLLGGAAARSVEADLFALLASNPAMSDAVTLIHADHGNTTTGVITAATVGAARVLMRKQVVTGTTDDYLNIQPAVLLCAEEKRDTAAVLMAAEDNPESSRSRVPNPVRNAATVVSSPRVADPKWYLFADPAIAAALEVAFLDGNQEPFLDMQDGFTVDGALYKVRLDYGVAALDWQPIVYSTGS